MPTTIRTIFAALALAPVCAAPLPAQDPPEDFASPPAAVAPQIDPDPVGLEARLGYAEYQAILKPDRWYPLRATVEARETDVKGKLLVRQEGNPLVVEIPVEVPKGSTHLFRSHYRPASSASMAGDRVLVELADPNVEEDIFAPISLRWIDDDAERHVLALVDADDRGSLAALERRRDEFEEDSRGAAGPTRRVVYGAPEFLPEEAIALEPLDAIVVSGACVRSIREEQWSAIREWVAHGGNLVVAGGKFAEFVRLASMPDGLRPPFGEPATTDGLLATPVESVAPWRRLRLANGAEGRLAAARDFGAGRVVAAEASMDRTLLGGERAAPADPAQWDAALDRSPPPPLARRLSPDDLRGLSLGLQDPLGVELPPTGWVIAFLAIYILLVAPANYWFCARAGRRERFWPIAVALAVVFSIAGWRTGVGGRSREMQAVEVSFLSQAPPTGEGSATRARGLTLSCAMAPSRRVLQPRFEEIVFATPAGSRIEAGFGGGFGGFGGGGFGVPGLGRRGFGAPGFGAPLGAAGPLARRAEVGSGLALRFGESTEFPDYSMFAWVPRASWQEYLADAGGGVDFDVRPVETGEGGVRLEGTATNRTPWTFAAGSWWLTDGTALATGDEDLPPGATRSIGGETNAGWIQPFFVFDRIARMADVPGVWSAVGQSGTTRPLQRISEGEILFLGATAPQPLPGRVPVGAEPEPGLLLYEARAGATRSAGGAAGRFQSSWKAVAVDEDGFATPSPLPAELGDAFQLSAEVGRIRLVPPVPFGAPPSSLAIRAIVERFDSGASRSEDLYDASGRSHYPRDVEVRAIAPGSGETQTVGRAGGEPLRIESPARFLDPRDGGLTLEVHATAEGMRFAPRGADENDVRPLSELVAPPPGVYPYQADGMWRIASEVAAHASPAKEPPPVLIRFVRVVAEFAEPEGGVAP